MKKFEVQFWFYTDLRQSITVNATDEIRALAHALDEISDKIWVDGAGFKVSIIFLENL